MPVFLAEKYRVTNFDFSGIYFINSPQNVVVDVKKSHKIPSKIVLFMAEKSLHKTDKYVRLIMNRYGRSMTIPVFPGSLVSGAFPQATISNTGTFSCGEKISVRKHMEN